jgi:hypothetical protein
MPSPPPADIQYPDLVAKARVLLVHLARTTRCPTGTSAPRTWP